MICRPGRRAGSFRGGYGWKVSLVYAACGWAFLYIFYDKVMNVLWHPSLLA